MDDYKKAYRQKCKKKEKSKSNHEINKEKRFEFTVPPTQKKRVLFKKYEQK